jgi:hypothetical protein
MIGGLGRESFDPSMRIGERKPEMEKKIEIPKHGMRILSGAVSYKRTNQAMTKAIR